MRSVPSRRITRQRIELLGESEASPTKFSIPFEALDADVGPLLARRAPAVRRALPLFTSAAAAAAPRALPWKRLLKKRSIVVVVSPPIFNPSKGLQTRARARSRSTTQHRHAERVSCLFVSLSLSVDLTHLTMYGRERERERSAHLAHAVRGRIAMCIRRNVYTCVCIREAGQLYEWSLRGFY